MRATFLSIAACGAAIGATMPAAAQMATGQSGGQQSREQKQVRKQNQDQTQQQKRKQSQSQAPGQYQLDPEALTILGYDTDNDGRTDVYYWVTQWDVEQIRRDQQQFERTGQAQQRRTSERRMGMAQQQPAGTQRSGQQQQQQPKQQHRFTGTLSDLSTFRFSNDGKTHVVGKVKLASGRTVPVLFGPREQLDIDLSPGQRISFSGRAGRINDSRVIVASSVDGTPLQGTQGGQPRLRRVSGTIERMGTFTPDGKSQEHMLASVRTRSGRSAVVDLGPESRLRGSDLDLSRGSKIQFLASTGLINGQPVMLARKVTTPEADDVINIERQQTVLSTNEPLPVGQRGSDR